MFNKTHVDGATVHISGLDRTVTASVEVNNIDVDTRPGRVRIYPDGSLLPPDVPVVSTSVVDSGRVVVALDDGYLVVYGFTTKTIDGGDNIQLSVHSDRWEVFES